MKNINRLLIILTTCALFSCKKYLDRVPLDTINSSNAWNTEADAIAAINGAYQPLQWPKLYNLRMWTTDIWANNSVVGAGGGTDGIETQDIANSITTTDNAAALDILRGPAPGILRANLVLANVPRMNIGADIKNQILGEAYFLRAHYYFILVRLFGDVPLTTEPVTSESNLRPTRTPKAQVYDLIVNDLKQAITLLPERSAYSGENVGRASKGAATGMLAKVYLTLGNYSEVVNLCRNVTSMGYKLNSDYSENFNPTTENSIESLFEVQYSGKTKFSFWDNENQASWVSTFTGPRNSNWVGGGYGWNQPTAEFVSQYEANDKRKDKTILYVGGPEFDGKQYQASFSTTGYNLRKFLVPKSISPDYDTNPLNWVVLRYADVLLMEAEALTELNRLNEAVAPLNLVRQRAGLSTISVSNQQDLRNKIRKERRIELAFEGHWWFDVIRYENGQYAVNYFHALGKTNFTTKHLLLPIPQKEIDANPNLTQNPGY